MKPKLGTEFSPDGVVQLPPSKSIANRLLILSALAGKPGPIERMAEADDTRLLRVLLHSSEETIDVGIAGTVCRFLTAYLALKPGTWTITGAVRMHERPIGILVDALRELGANIEYTGKEGFLPLKIRGGQLKGGSVAVPGDVSSQYISALLMIGPYLEEGLKLKILPPFYSVPYVQMTVDLMRQSGAGIRFEDEEYLVKPKPYSYIPLVVEADWSAAAFFYSLVALSKSGTIYLKDLYAGSLQGDARCVELFSHLGVKSEFDSTGVRITKTANRLLPDFLEINCSDIPDLVQSLACTCAGLEVPVRFTGVKSLRIKETDRIAAIEKELSRLGVDIVTGDDEILLKSFGSPKEFRIKTYNDHRMAMAFAPLSIKFPDLEIEDPQVVSKSYPGFWTAIRELVEGD